MRRRCDCNLPKSCDCNLPVRGVILSTPLNTHPRKTETPWGRQPTRPLARCGGGLQGWTVGSARPARWCAWTITFVSDRLFGTDPSPSLDGWMVRPLRHCGIRSTATRHHSVVACRAAHARVAIQMSVTRIKDSNSAIIDIARPYVSRKTSRRYGELLWFTPPGGVNDTV